jgi:hypothetical protein
MGRVDNIHEEVTLARRRQIYQTELLQHVDDTIEQHTTHSSLHATRREAQSQKNATQLASVEKKVDSLITTVGQLLQHARPLPTPSDLKAPCDQYMEALQIAGNMHPMKVSSSRWDGAVKHDKTTTLRCTCIKSGRQQTKELSQRWIFISWTEFLDHSHYCPLAFRSQHSTSRQLRACWTALGYLVEASLEWSNKSLSPRIRCRNTVPYSSPAFRVIDAFSVYIRDLRLCDGEPAVRFQPAISMVTEALLCLFRDGRASPFDTDMDGFTLVHVCFFPFPCF